MLACFLCTASLIGNAAACQICVPRPTHTLADRLLSSDAVVLAREDPQRPYHFAAVQTLKGDPGAAAIDLFMNTPARRRLAADPASAMLLGRDAKSGEWRHLGIARGDYARVVRRILGFQGQWVANETNNLARLRELAPLLGHEDLRLHELAYLEVGRAPYASIQRVGVDVPLEKVRAMLADPRYLEWRGLGILLLGLSGAEPDRARVTREMAERQRSSATLNLDAWATAYVQVTGAAGVADLQRWYFAAPQRTRDELRNIVRALSVQAAGNTALRAPVLAAYRELVDNHPFAAPDITHDLIAWQHWALAAQLSRLRPQIAERDPLGAYAVMLYLDRAAAHGRNVMR